MQDIVQKATPMANLESILNHNGPNKHQYKILDDLIENFHSSEINSIEEVTSGIREYGFMKETTSLIGHVLNKPYGYAGDFEIIDRLYRNDVSNDYYNWDKYILNTNAVKAVQNRKTYFKKLVLNKLNDQKFNLLNIASGPARDLKEVYDLINHSDQLQTTCIDMDADAIEYAKEVNKGYTHNIEFVNKNVLRYKTEKKYDLVWSAGLFDYFDDKAFLLMLNRMKEWVSDNGEIVVGNFNEDHNPTRSVMEILGDWHLLHRSEDQLIDLALKAGFTREQISIGREPENINLFLHIKNSI